MSWTLADKIEGVLDRESCMLSCNGKPPVDVLALIREMQARLEEANQLFQDVCDFTDLDSEANRAAYKGTYVTDTVADYPTKTTL